MKETTKNIKPREKITLFDISFFNTPFSEKDSNAIDKEENNPTLRRFV